MKFSSLLLVSALSFGSLTALADVGTFMVPVGEGTPMPAFPGKTYEFTVNAAKGEKLNFTSMFGASNDWFFSSMSGITLRHGNWDITNHIEVYDAGSEEDQNPADAPDTAPNQPAPNTGLADPVNAVRCLSAFPGFKAQEFIKVTSHYISGNTYKIRIHVKETSRTPLSPGVFWTSRTGYKPYKINAMRMDNGLEAQSGDGNPATLFETVKAHLN